MTNLGSLLATSQLGRLLASLLNLFELALFGRVILSWFPVSPGSAMANVYRFLYTLTEPVIGPIRRILPAMGGFDFSPIIVFFVIELLLKPIAYSL